ncbi:MAG: hypothetical protein WDO74_17010 [Pseudomonadota bacterium]
MTDHTIVLSVGQLHDIVGSMFEIGWNPPLELATSTMFHAAEELRVVSTAILCGVDNQIDVGNVIQVLSDRLGAMAKLCNEIDKSGKRSTPIALDESEVGR